MGCAKSRPHQPGPSNPGAETRTRDTDVSATTGTDADVSDDVSPGASFGDTTSTTTNAAVSSAATTSTAIVVQSFTQATDGVDCDDGGNNGTGLADSKPSPPRLMMAPPSNRDDMIEVSAPSAATGDGNSPAPESIQSDSGNPESLHGVLQKLSPASGRGWQARLFVVAIAPDAVLTSRSRAFLFYYKRSTARKAATKSKHRASVFGADNVQCGYLEKLSSGNVTAARRWQKRHFRMGGHYLKYYKSADDNEHAVKGSIDLEELIHVHIVEVGQGAGAGVNGNGNRNTAPAGGRVLRLQLDRPNSPSTDAVSPGRALDLRAGSSEEARLWLAQLRRFERARAAGSLEASGGIDLACAANTSSAVKSKGGSRALMLAGAPTQVGWQVAGRIDIDDVKVVKSHYNRKTGKSDPSRFSVVVGMVGGGERCFELKAESAASASEWRDGVEQLMNKYGNGRACELFSTSMTTPGSRQSPTRNPLHGGAEEVA